MPSLLSSIGYLGIVDSSKELVYANELYECSDDQLPCAVRQKQVNPNIFWGTSENAVRIQIYVAVITYCLVAIVEHDCQLGRTTFNVLRVLSRVLTDKTSIRDLFKGSETIEDADDETVQLQFDFKY